MDLHELISNPGYDCVVENIFSNMDPNTLANCRLVSKQWKDVIDNRKALLICQLQHLKLNQLEVEHSDDFKKDCSKPGRFWNKLRNVVWAKRKQSVIERFPAFRQVFLDLERSATQQELKEIVAFMKNYCKDGRLPKCLPKDNWNEIFSISPLYQAIELGDPGFVRILLKRSTGATSNFDNLLYFTHVAVQYNQATIVEQFMDFAREKSLNINAPDKKGRTAFHYACMNGSMNVIKLLLEKVEEELLNVNVLDHDGNAALHWACIGNQHETVQNVFELSTKHGININAIDRNGLTLLHLAAQYGHNKVAKVILEASLERGINVNALDFENRSAFSYACMYGNFQAAKLMVEKSREYQIDLNLVDFQGNSPMNYAVEYLHLDIARVMIDESKDKGIELNQEDDFFRYQLLFIYGILQSIGSLVFGRRQDLWNPLMIAALIAFVGPTSIVFSGIYFWIVIGITIVQWVFQQEPDIECFNDNFMYWLEDLFLDINEQCGLWDEGYELAKLAEASSGVNVINVIIVMVIGISIPFFFVFLSTKSKVIMRFNLNIFHAVNDTIHTVLNYILGENF